MPRLRVTCYWLAILAITMFCAEFASRLQDFARAGIPLLHTPDHDRDLVITGPSGERRGRPYGVYQRWKLNQFGFRGPEMRVQCSADTVRILVLGSSEAFGLYESSGNEFPARLEQELKAQGRYEVVNAALPGMTIRSMTHQYTNWSSRFGAHYVIIYANPLFYLNAPDSAPAAVAVGNAGAKHARWQAQQVTPKPRLLLRLKDVVALPQWFVDLRDARRVEAIRQSHEVEWAFQQLPRKQLDDYTNDLVALAETIKRNGATPVLVTHARKTLDGNSRNDRIDVTRSLIHTPRATPEVSIAFATAANQAVRELADSQNLPLVDLESALSGKQQCFADLVHFNDEGAAQVAQRLAMTIVANVRERARIH